MTYRRRKRPKSAASQISGDVIYIANRLSWRGSLIFGASVFVIFYWVAPIWLNYQLSNVNSSILRPVIESLFARRIHWFEWLGIASAVICISVAVYKYVTSRYLDRAEERDVSFLGRLIARFIN